VAAGWQSTAALASNAAQLPFISRRFRFHSATEYARQLNRMTKEDAELHRMARRSTSANRCRPIVPSWCVSDGPAQHVGVRPALKRVAGRQRLARAGADGPRNWKTLSCGCGGNGFKPA
jgi:hypothetical protein